MRTEEKNARQLTCPVSMGNSHMKPQLCQGAACMAWRWEQAEPGPDDESGNADERMGYCGMASTPLEVIRTAILETQRELMSPPAPDRHAERSGS